MMWTVVLAYIRIVVKFLWGFLRWYCQKFHKQWQSDYTVTLNETAKGRFRHVYSGLSLTIVFRLCSRCGLFRRLYP